MTTIHRHALVCYSPRQMFELVNQIEDYPRFLPWCHKTHILMRTEEMVEATIEVAWSGIHKSFTTRNVLHPFQKMEITLVAGPFKQLEGRWQFIPLGDEGSKVILDLEFELGRGFLDRMFHPIFHQMANSLVEAFCKRAVEIYGSQ